jgi:hypothetical protein
VDLADISAVDISAVDISFFLETSESKMRIFTGDEVGLVKGIQTTTRTNL